VPVVATPTPTPRAEKPIIELSAAQLGNAAVQAMYALRDQGAVIYQRDGALVRPVRDPAIDSNGNPIASVSLVKITESFLKLLMYGHLSFKQKTKSGSLDVGPGREIAKLILVSARQVAVPHTNRIACCANAPSRWFVAFRRRIRCRYRSVFV
jgi:hypothetical protein